MEESREAGVGVGVTTTTDPVLAGGGGSFSQLLFSDADDDVQLVTPTSTKLMIEHHHHHHHGCFNFAAPTTFSSDQKPPTMLSFGDCNNNINDDVGNYYKINNGAHYQLVFGNHQVSKSICTAPSMNSAATCTTAAADSSSTSSTAKNINTTNNSLPKSNRKRNGCNENEPIGQSLTTGPGGPVRTQRNCKKTRSEISANGGHAKVKKERLGERIAALQQLVSPFGKTDTASVLHEATGYIKFLQEQVQVLCSPYLQRTPSNSSNPLLPQGIDENEEGELKRNSLKSRGLCLVPVDCTLHVAESNGADFWSPAMVNNGSSGL